MWHRLTWAVEKATSDDVHESNIGLVVLTELVQSPDTRESDYDMLEQVNENVVNRITANKDTKPTAQ